MDVAKIAGSSALLGQAGSNPGSVKESGASSFQARQPIEVEQQVRREQSRAELESSVSDILSRVQMVQRNLNFSVDDSTGQVVVKVIDGESGKLVRQIPSEELLELAERFDEMRSLMQETRA